MPSQSTKFRFANSKRFNVLQKLSFAVLVAGALVSAPSAFSANDAFDTAPTASGGIANFTANFTLGTTTPAASGTGTPASGDALYFGTSNTTTLNNDLTAGINFAGLNFNTGASAFTIQGNAFTLTGNVTNNSASLQTINNAITLATATRTFSAASGSLTLGGGLTGFGNASDAIFTAASGQTITVSGFTGSSGGNDGILINGAGNTTIGAISEAAATNRGFSLTQSGTGSVTLTGANNLRNNSNGAGSSVVTLNSGTLNLANAAALSTGTGIATNLVINGGTLDATNGVTALTYTGNAATQNWNGSFTFTGTNSLNMGAGAVTVASGASVTATITANTLTGGALTNNGSLTKAGTGTLTLGNLTSGLGSTITDSAGILALGTVTGRATGGTVDFGGTLANITTTSANTAANAIIGGYATVNGGTNFAVVNGGKIAAYSGTTSALPVTGGATTDQDTLAGSQTQTGNALANSLIVSNTANSDTLALGTNSLTLTGAAGALLYTGGSDNNFAITGTGVVGGGTTGEFIVNTDAGTTLSISAPIVSTTATAGSLTKTGTGTLVLSGASSYTGATTIGQGTVKVGVAQVGTTSGPFGNGSGALTLGAGTTLDLQGNNVTVGTTTANGGGTNSIVTSTAAATLTMAGGSNLTTLNASGAASILINGGSGTTLVTGTTLITGTGSLGFENQTGTLRDNNVATNLGANGSLLFNGLGQFQNTVGLTLAAGNTVIINGTGNQWNYQSSSNAATTVPGAVTGSGSLNLTNGFNPSFTLSGDLTGFHGSLTLSGSGNGQAIQFSNTTTFSNDANFTLTPTTAPTAAANTSTFMTYIGTGNKTIILGSLSGTTLAGTGAGVGFSSFPVLTDNTAATTATWQIGGANANTSFAGVIQNGTGTSAVTKVGSGTLTLSGVNTYTGATSVSNGTLNLAATKTISASAISTTGITVASTGTLALTAASALNTPGATTSVTSGSPVSVAGQVPITLSGGTLLRNGTGVSLGTQSGTAGTVGIGMLTLTAASTIDYGTTGVGTLNFNAISGLSSTNTLSIVDYTTTHPGAAGTDGTDDRFIVNQDLTSSLSYITIDGVTPSSEISLGNGEFELSVVAVPEPSSWVGGMLGLAGLAFRLRRPLAGALKRRSVV